MCASGWRQHPRVHLQNGVADVCLALKSTDSEAPACLLLQSVVSGSTYSHFECDVEQTTFELLATPASDASSFFFATTEDLFTDEPTSTRARRSSTTSSLEVISSSELEGSSTTEDVSSSALGTTTAAGGTSGRGFTQSAAGAPSTSSTGAAVRRTGEAVAGALGGVLGLMALL
jgi:hypothetical protein